MIQKGTVWEYDGDRVEFMVDVCGGDPGVNTSVKINGQHPKVGQRIPQWMIQGISKMRKKIGIVPFSGVRVTPPL